MDFKIILVVHVSNKTQIQKVNGRMSAGRIFEMEYIQFNRFTACAEYIYIFLKYLTMTAILIF